MPVPGAAPVMELVETSSVSRGGAGCPGRPKCCASAASPGIGMGSPVHVMELSNRSHPEKLSQSRNPTLMSLNVLRHICIKDLGPKYAAHSPSSPCSPCLPLQIAPTEVRGALGSVNQLVICLGILGALLVNVMFPPAAWRTMFYLSALPAILLGLGARPTTRPWDTRRRWAAAVLQAWTLGLGVQPHRRERAWLAA